MVFWAVAVVLFGIGLKAIAAEAGSMILLPLAVVYAVAQRAFIRGIALSGFGGR